MYNHHSSKPLYYFWPIAQGFENEGLPPHESDIVCSLADDYAKPASSGPLYFGRSGQQTRTLVWKSMNDVVKSEKEEPEAANHHSHRARGGLGEFIEDDSADGTGGYISSVLVTADLHTFVFRQRQYVLFLPMPRKKERVDAHLTFSSEVKRTASGYSIQNRVLNLNADTAINAKLVF